MSIQNNLGQPLLQPIAASSRDCFTPPRNKRMPRWTKSIVTLLSGTLLLSGCAGVSSSPNSATPSEEGMSNTEACESITVILGPINSGAPSAEEFDKTFTVLEALTQELSSQELKDALVDYTTKGRIVIAEIQELGTFKPESMANWRQSVDNMILTCAPHLF
jgi:hypothetical protein